MQIPLLVTCVLRGHLDVVASLGYIEGWAFDTELPTKLLELSILWNGMEVAWGLAHRFRADLMAAGFGLGWCAFCLRLSSSLAEIQTGSVQLVERATGAELYAVKEIAQIHDPELPKRWPQNYRSANCSAGGSYDEVQIGDCEPRESRWRCRLTNRSSLGLVTPGYSSGYYVENTRIFATRLTIRWSIAA